MMIPHTGWNAKLNFQVSLFNELCAEIRIASSCLQIQRNQIIIINNNNNNNNNNNLFIYSALFNMLGDQKRITTINNLKAINTNIKIIQTYLISKTC